MRTKKFLFAVTLGFLLCTAGQSQILNKLKSVANKNKDKLKLVGEDIASDLQRARDSFDSTDFDYALILSDASSFFNMKQKKELSSKLTTTASLGASFYKDQDENEQTKARFHLEMGELAYATRKFAYAEKRYISAKDIYEAEQSTEDIGYLKTMSNLALLYASMGRYTQAQSLNETVLNKRIEVLGADNIGVGASYNNLGVVAYNLADYTRADSCFQQAMRIMETNQLQASMSYAIALNNQAMLLQKTGDYKQASKQLKRAISMAEAFQREKSNKHLKLISNLALLYQNTDGQASADSIYSFLEGRLGKKNPDKANMYNNWAALALQQGAYKEVESRLRKSMAINKSYFGDESPAFAKSAAFLGHYFTISKQYTEAQPLLEQAMAIRIASLGPDHPETVQSKEDWAIFNWKTGNVEAAAEQYKEVMETTMGFIESYFPAMSEAEKASYWALLYPRIQRFQSFLIDQHQTHPAYAKTLLELQIETKAILLSSSSKIKNAILNSGDQSVVDLYQQWVDNKETLVRYYAYSPAQIEEQNIQLDSVMEATNAIEKQLSVLSSEFNSGIKKNTITFKTVQTALKEKEAIVDVVKLKDNLTASNSTQYAFIIVRKDLANPVVVVAENGENMDGKNFKFYRNAIKSDIEDGISYGVYWAFLEEKLQGVSTIYIAPDGVYNQINLNTLKADAYLISKYDFHRIGNIRDLVDKQSNTTSTGRYAAFFGDPAFNSSKIANLPGTKTEVYNISKVLGSIGYKTNKYTGDMATETNLKKQKNKRYLHIATHGYFLEDAKENNSNFGVHFENAIDNPLLRSGLLLTGAGKTVDTQVPDLVSKDNGVLTGFEAMNLNLEGTELVVLSACETGLGDVKDGEGVYGLQRAFFIAGAKTIVMSLWKVDDQATQQLMTYFYKNLAKNSNKTKAFKQAQLQLKAKFPSPNYWGAFVMIGL